MIYNAETNYTTIFIGRTGETNHRQIVFDVSDWLTQYPLASVTALFSRPDGETYPVTLTLNAESKTAVWNITAAEVAAAGKGVIQLQLYNGNVIAKSTKHRTTADASLEAGPVPPNPEMNWVDELMIAASHANAATQNANAATENAKVVTAEASLAASKAVEASREAVKTANEAVAAAEAAADKAANVKDGVTPHIGTNGNWYLGDDDTGVKAEGQDGAQGPQGEPGKDGAPGERGADGAKGDGGSSVISIYSEISSNVGDKPFIRKEDYPSAKEGDTAFYFGATNNYISRGAVGKLEPVSGHPSLLAIDVVEGICIIGDKGDTGEQGPAGADGQDGVPGKDGAQGPQGEPGKDGAPGKDGVSVTHEWNGTTLTVTSASGTSSADLKGEKGDTGAQGPQGEKGETGAAGKDGADGKDGAQGPQGEPGKDGADGKDGANGKDGVSVTHEWNGTTLTVTSASGTSSADLKGEKGDTGAQGPQGEKGDTGADGKDGTDGTNVIIVQTIDATDGGFNMILCSKYPNAKLGDIVHYLGEQSGVLPYGGIAVLSSANDDAYYGLAPLVNSAQKPLSIASTGIKSVEQTTTSTEPSGLNIITVTLSDGTTSTFTVRNGTSGDGKSAYEYAVEGGYDGSEVTFAKALADTANAEWHALHEEWAQGESIIPSTTLRYVAGAETVTLTVEDETLTKIKADSWYDVNWSDNRYKMQAINTSSGKVALGDKTYTKYPFYIEVTSATKMTISRTESEYSGTYSFFINALEKDIYHKLPNEFLPEGYPYVISEAQEGAILPETELLFNESMDMYTIPLVDVIPTEGDKCTIVYNGVNYNCVAYYFAAADVAGYALGNSSPIGGADTGEPFFMGFFLPEFAEEGGFGGFLIPLDGAETITLEVIGEIPEVIKKLDNKFVDAEWMATRSLQEVALVENTNINSRMDMYQEGSAGYCRLQLGETYRVIWNDVTYDNLIARNMSIATSNGTIEYATIGNQNIIDDTLSDTGEPFVYYSHASGISGCRQRESVDSYFSIYANQLMPDKLPKEFLPDLVYENKTYDLNGLGIPTVVSNTNMALDYNEINLSEVFASARKNGTVMVQINVDNFGTVVGSASYSGDTSGLLNQLSLMYSKLTDGEEIQANVIQIYSYDEFAQLVIKHFTIGT